MDTLLLAISSGYDHDHFCISPHEGSAFAYYYIIVLVVFGFKLRASYLLGRQALNHLSLQLCDFHIFVSDLSSCVRDVHLFCNTLSCSMF
jgi:hypothetical protein